MANYAGAERQLTRLLRPDGGGQFAITRTWTDDLGTHTATGHGVAAEAPQRSRAGKSAGKVTVDIGMADPFFYGDPMDVALPVGVPVTVDNPGDEATTAITVDFAGALSNPQVTNTSTAPEVYLKVGTDLASGDALAVDVLATSVVRDSDAANLIGALTHSGSRAWLVLKRGTNTLVLTTDSGAGSAVVTYLPVYY
jgi:hypothetical protein